MENRGKWSSNMGFILAAIGSAIGLGNLWGFPYKMGANGGLPFLIIYLLLVIFCGVIVMGVEMTIGRNTGKSPILALTSLAKKWKIVGVMGVSCSFLIMGFYSVILGYAVRYFVGYIIAIFGGSGFGGMTAGGEFFGAYTGNVGAVVLYTFITFALCAVIVAGGVEKGLERFNKVGIPALFLILIVLIIYNLTLEGSGEGLVFMFTSKGMEMAGTKFNFFKAVRTAAGQMLFSLSLGMGCLITYGSYLDKKESIAQNAWIIPAFDTLAALLAGLAIFPAVFATGNNPAGGPGLLFVTMFDVFATMGGIGNVLGALFYLLVIFAGVSSAISLMEVATASILDAQIAKGKKPNRTVITVIITMVMFVLAIFVSMDKLGGNEKLHFLYMWLGEGSQDLLDVYDFIAEGVFMPLGSILMCLLVGWKLGFPWMKKEVRLDGRAWKCEGFFEVCVKYVTPALMTFVLISLALSYLGL